MKILAVIQCTADEVHSTDPNDYCIAPLQNSKIFDAIVLAVPKIGNFSIFDKLSKKWKVDVYYGSKYNVAERVHNASKKYFPDIVVRVLLRRFYVDLNLIKVMINALNGYDYVNLDNNVNNEVAADVSTFGAIKKAVKLLKKLPNDYESNSFRFNPWRFMECNNAFKITTINYKEKWNKTQIVKTRKRIQFLLNNEEDWAQPIDENSPVNRYKFISKFIEKNDVVLDIACGKGGGSVILSEVAKQVYGIDYNLSYISYAKSKFNKNNLEFVHGTDEFLEKIQTKFDKVVSAHTMEHVEDDEIFLKRIKKCLKKDGKLILDVPRFFPYPLGIPLWPVHKREYTKESLENILNKTGFEIETAYGINRRNYVNVENARDSFLYVCKNKI